MAAIILALIMTLAPAGPWLDGVATWYCLPQHSACTAGYADSGMFAAPSPDYGIVPGARVEVCHAAKCVTVRAVDVCATCQRTIDLYAAAFSRIAQLGDGRIDVTLRVVQLGVFGDLTTAGGYKTRPATPYVAGRTLLVRDGEYITVRVDVGPELEGRPVEFWQRNGKSGTWVRRTIGRVDSQGFAYWSTRPPLLHGAGYDRYVYYRARFAGTTTIGPAWSPGVGRAVVLLTDKR